MRSKLSPRVSNQTGSLRITHMQTERKRRSDMHNLFETMRSLLPMPTPKNDRCTTISDTIMYIQSLQRKLEGLKKKRAELAESIVQGQNPGSIIQETGSSLVVPANSSTDSVKVVLDPLSPANLNTGTPELHGRRNIIQQLAVSFCGSNVVITLTSSRIADILSGLLSILEELGIQIISASTSKNDDTNVFSIHGKATEVSMLAREALRDAIRSFTGRYANQK